MIFRYEIDKAVGLEPVMAAVEQHLGLISVPGHHLQRHYLDTLDWRLYRKGYCLEAAKEKDDVRLRLYELPGFNLVSLGIGNCVPTFANTLPLGKLRQLLSPLLGARALVHQVDVACTQYNVPVKNRQGKSVARITIESTQMLKPVNSPETFDNLYFEPYKGFDKQVTSRFEFLKNLKGITLSESNIFQCYLNQVENTPDSADKKYLVEFEPRERSNDAVKRLLSNLSATLRENRAPIINDIDIECLHEFRIAVRRSRVALKQLPQLFSKRETTRFCNQLQQLGALTTTLRDLDVILYEFSDYLDMLPSEERGHLASLKQYVLREREEHHVQLSHYLKSRKFESFISAWDEFLKSPGPTVSRLKNATKSIDKFINAQIWKCYKRVLKDGRKIGPESVPEELHELRKDCKKLRYLIEFSRSLHPEKEIRKAIRIMKKLQDILGEFQDISVHTDLFRSLYQQMAEQQLLTQDTALAIQTITSKLQSRQQTVRDQFDDIFDQFASEQHQATFTELFKK